MRVGKFRVLNKTLNSKLIDVKFYNQVLFTNIFILSQRKIPANKCTEFKAICDDFDDIQDGDDVPEYKVRIDKKNNKPVFKRKMVKKLQE